MAEKVAKAELLSATYFTEHNIPMQAADNFAEFCKRAFPDSEVAKRISFKKTKLSYIIQDGIAFYERVDLVKILKSCQFSLLIDKSTDVSITQVLAVVVRFFDPTVKDVRDVFLTQ